MTHCKVSFQNFLRGNYKETADVDRKTPTQSSIFGLSAMIGNRHTTTIYEDQHGIFMSVELLWLLHQGTEKPQKYIRYSIIQTHSKAHVIYIP